MEEQLRKLLFPAPGEDTQAVTAEAYSTLTQKIGYPLADRFFSQLPGLRGALREDLKAVMAGDPAAWSEEEVIACYPGLDAVAAYRVANCLWRLEVPLLPRIMAEQAHSRTGIDIHPGARIGPGFFIDHGTGVVIGETAVIGSNVRLYQGVTLGALSTRDAQLLRGIKRHPTVEDDVTIYAGATILGGETVIGKGSVIGAGVLLTGSVPPDTRVSLAQPPLQFHRIKREP